MKNLTSIRTKRRHTDIELILRKQKENKSINFTSADFPIKVIADDKTVLNAVFTLDVKFPNENHPVWTVTLKSTPRETGIFFKPQISVGERLSTSEENLWHFYQVGGVCTCRDLLTKDELYEQIVGDVLSMRLIMKQIPRTTAWTEVRRQIGYILGK